MAEIFQSTPPVKAATTDSANVPTRPLFQSTPPVKAATSSHAEASGCAFISIHAAREGGDENICPHNEVRYLFQSTPPVKAATVTAF